MEDRCPSRTNDCLRVLLVEDLPADVALTLSAWREVIGDTDIFDIAADAAAALHHLAHSRPDLILLDVCLPGMSGLELIGHIRANPQTADIPIVVWTSNGLSTEVRAAYRAGANAYLMKPLEMVKFREFVAVCAYFWHSALLPRPAGGDGC